MKSVNIIFDLEMVKFKAFFKEKCDFLHVGGSNIYQPSRHFCQKKWVNDFKILFPLFLFDVNLHLFLQNFFPQNSSNLKLKKKLFAFLLF